jgi:hypothetical protein
MHSDAINALKILRSQGESLHITPQNTIEFWNVYTRPWERNGLGRTASEADTEWEHPNFALGINTQRQEQRKGGQ